MRQQSHEATFDTTPETIFDLLIRPSAIRAWWSAHSAIVQPQSSGIWAATWGELEDDPDYIGSAQISTFDRPHRLVLTNYRYYARSGPLPFDANFSVTFDVQASSEGAVLHITQSGFPDAPEASAFFEGCNVGWKATLDGIRKYLHDH